MGWDISVLNCTGNCCLGHGHVLNDKAAHHFQQECDLQLLGKAAYGVVTLRPVSINGGKNRDLPVMSV